MSDMMEAAHKAMTLAQASGADEVALSLSRSRGVDLEWRDGAIERVQEQTRQSLSTEIYVNGRYSASSTSDLRPDALRSFFSDAVEMTKLLEPDPHRSLPDPNLYEGRADVDLQLADSSHSNQDGAGRRAQCEELETLLREGAEDLPIVSVATTVSDSIGHSARVHSNGFEGARAGTSFSASAMVTVLDEDGRRPMGWEYSYRRFQEDLDPLEWIARRAREKARAQLGATQVKTGKYTIVLENRAVPRLLSALLGPISGPALQQRRSLWEGRLGDQITSPLLTIYDEPHLVRGLNSSLWDGDGFATQRRPIIEAGVLKTYLIDQYYARKMGIEPSGGDTHNLDWTLGTKSLDGLVSDVEHGVFIDRFLGGNSNSTTGEISLGCAGRMIRNGELAEPVSEANLSGHFGQIWEQLIELGNDPNPNSSSGAPSCAFSNVQLSGS